MARWQARAAALKLRRRALKWVRRQAASRALRSRAVQSAASRERGRPLLAGVSGLKRRAGRRAWASWRDAVGVVYIIYRKRHGVSGARETGRTTAPGT